VLKKRIQKVVGFGPIFTQCYELGLPAGVVHPRAGHLESNRIEWIFSPSFLFFLVACYYCKFIRATDNRSPSTELSTVVCFQYPLNGRRCPKVNGRLLLRYVHVTRLGFWKEKRRASNRERKKKSHHRMNRTAPVILARRPQQERTYRIDPLLVVFTRSRWFRHVEATFDHPCLWYLNHH
jgi:hypothetical protein